MGRPRKHPEQASLIVEPEDRIWSVFEKVKAAGVLSADELVLLEQAIHGDLPKPKRFRNWQLVVNAWLATSNRYLGGRAAKPTPTEWNQLLSIAKRVGSASLTCELIEWYWRWRDQVAWDFKPQPTTFGFSKHLAAVQEFAARQKQKQDAASAAVKGIDQAIAAAKVTREEVKEHLSCLPWRKEQGNG